jgi:hypothetical protein
MLSQSFTNAAWPGADFSFNHIVSWHFAGERSSDGNHQYLVSVDVSQLPDDLE